MRVVFALVAVVTALGIGSPAWAQPEPGQQPADPRTRDAGYIGKDIPTLEIDDCPPPPEGAPDKLRAVGSEHFQRGEVLYIQGDYRGAVKELAAAYCIAPFYTILKDIGQAYERELEYEKAIAYLERFVMAVPKDAVKPNACAPDPQDDKRNVIARIKVLEQLKAKIRINTDPPEATVTLSNDAGIAGRGVSGQELEVTGGRYELQIDAKGFHSVTQEVKAEIGKPYTIFAKLDPLTAPVSVRVVPADARLFLDKRQVGTGAYASDLPGGRYTLSAEAPGRLTVSRVIEVVPPNDTNISIELPPEPQFGRRQLLGYSAVGGAAAGGLVAGFSSSPPVIATGIGVGLVSGFVGTYFATPKDIALGTSSLTITSSLIGGTLGGTTFLIFTEDGNRIAPAIGGGLLAGAVVGYTAGNRLRIKPGDAAVINSGALWGGVTGSLFAGSFDADNRIGAGLVLSGLAMGTVGGVLITRYFNVSRARAALIDVGGVVGVFVGIAIDSVVASQGSGAGTSSTETKTNFTLGGMGAGLLVSGIVTRNMDAPKLAIQPVIQKTSTAPGGGSTTTFGLGGSF